MWWQPTDVLQNYVMERGDMTSYTSLAAFSEATGQERHGVILDYDALEHVPMDDPSKPEAVYTPEGIDFTPKAGSAALDAGCVLPNITDGYIGKAPDLGAVERGAKPVVYGPRTGSRHP